MTDQHKPSHFEWAQVTWPQNQPYARLFQDVYFSSDDGVAETEYVFLQGNHLQNRWRHLSRQHFTINETGFGTGLNFLCAAKLWLEIAPPCAILHFVSVEKYPLNLQEITRALQLWPQLNGLSQPFLTQYARLLQSDETVALLENRVTLTLRIGDATEQLRALHYQADAWFLDGFAPSKNPEMWQPALFAQIARLSAPETTFATFTSASAVRRGLIAAGFSVQKRAGFGKKREMLQGQFMGLAHD